MQRFIIVLGLIVFFSPGVLISPIHLGTAPTGRVWASR